jgi:hypothetical protein
MSEPGPEVETDDDEHRTRRSALLHVGPPMSDAPPWVMTYSDIVAQLVCLLILLLSFAHFVPARYQQLRGSVEETFGRLVDNIGQSDLPPPAPGEADGAASRERGLLLGVRSLVARHSGRLTGGQVDVEVFEDYRGVVLRLGDAALFDDRQAFVRPSAWPFLEAAGAHATGETARLDIEVRVTPDPDARGDDDVRLAGARGLALLRYLIGQDAGLDPRHLSVRAVGANERAPVLPSAGNRTRGETVDFVFSRSSTQTDLPP